MIYSRYSPALTRIQRYLVPFSSLPPIDLLYSNNVYWHKVCGAPQHAYRAKSKDPTRHSDHQGRMFSRLVTFLISDPPIGFISPPNATSLSSLPTDYHLAGYGVLATNSIAINIALTSRATNARRVVHPFLVLVPTPAEQTTTKPPLMAMCVADPRLRTIPHTPWMSVKR